MEANIHPVLFRIGEFEVTSFGALVAVGALVGLWLFRRELRRAGLPDGAIDTGLAGVVGGLVGAKLLWVVEHLGEEPLADLLLTRGGMSWFGGFAGGLLAGLWLMRRRRLPVMAVLAAATASARPAVCRHCARGCRAGSVCRNPRSTCGTMRPVSHRKKPTRLTVALA